MEDPAGRQLAEQHRDELKRSYDHVLQTARQTRQAFDSFVAGLHHIRAKVEKDPSLETVNATRSLIAGTEKSGHEVQEQLSDILAELNVISANIAPPTASAQK